MESYKSLKTIPEEQSVKLLAQISNQLSSFAITSGFVNSTTPALIPSEFVHGETEVSLNVLWTVGLTLALISAAFAITVQQWLRQLTTPLHLSAQDAACLRQWRYDALLEWHVPSIINILPLLLLIAVFLFIAGLIAFVSPHSVAVAAAITGVSIFAFMFLALATFSPLFYANCPYKTAFLPTIIIAAHWCLAAMMGLIILAAAVFQASVTVFATLCSIIWPTNAMAEFGDSLLVRTERVQKRLSRSVVWITRRIRSIKFGRFWADRDIAVLSGMKLVAREIPAVAWDIATATEQEAVHIQKAFTTRDSEWTRDCMIQIMANAIGCPLPHALSDIYYLYPDCPRSIRLLNRLSGINPSSLCMFVRKEFIGPFVDALPAGLLDWKRLWFDDEDTLSVLLLLLHTAFVAGGRSPNTLQHIRLKMVHALLDARVVIESIFLGQPSTTASDSSGFNDVVRFWEMRLPGVLSCLDLRENDFLDTDGWSILLHHPNDVAYICSL